MMGTIMMMMIMLCMRRMSRMRMLGRTVGVRREGMRVIGVKRVEGGESGEETGGRSAASGEEGGTTGKERGTRIETERMRPGAISRKERARQGGERECEQESHSHRCPGRAQER